MNRFRGNPILAPQPKNAWESRMVFNAAAIYAKGKVHLVYRAMGNDGVSRLGYASSSDGYHIDERLPAPVFEPSTHVEKYGCEDPSTDGTTCVIRRLAAGFSAPIKSP
jgi:predicted GH43/DUF377 family glycosyl hydrolase